MNLSVSGPRGAVRKTFAPIRFPPTTSVKIWSPITAASLGFMPNFLQALRKPFGRGFALFSIYGTPRRLAKGFIRSLLLLEIMITGIPLPTVFLIHSGTPGKGS